MSGTDSVMSGTDSVVSGTDGVVSGNLSAVSGIECCERYTRCTVSGTQGIL